MTTDNFSTFFVTVVIRGTKIKLRGHRGFNPEPSSPESPVCTTAVHYHKMAKEMVVYKSVWTQRHKKHQRLGYDPGYRSVQGLSRDLRSPNAIF